MVRSYRKKIVEKANGYFTVKEEERLATATSYYRDFALLCMRRRNQDEQGKGDGAGGGGRVERGTALFAPSLPNIDPTRIYSERDEEIKPVSTRACTSTLTVSLEPDSTFWHSDSDIQSGFAISYTYGITKRKNQWRAKRCFIDYGRTFSSSVPNVWKPKFFEYVACDFVVIMMGKSRERNFGKAIPLVSQIWRE